MNFYMLVHIYVYVACNVGDANVVVQIHTHVKIKMDNAVELERTQPMEWSTTKVNACPRFLHNSLCQ